MSQHADVEYSHDDYVPVVYAHDWAEAKYYKVLLEDHAIPVMIEEESGSDHVPAEEGGGVLVMVPDEYLSEAQDVVERASEESDLDDLDDFGDEDDDELADLSVMEDLDGLGGRVLTEDEEDEVF